MQYYALRKAASSRLTLYAAIALLISTLLALVVVWHVISFEIVSLYDADTPQSLLNTRKNILMIPIGCIASLPVISMFIIYFNARSGASMNRRSYTMLRGVMLGLLAVCAVLIPVCLSILSKSRNIFALCLTLWLPVALFIAFSAANVLKTAQEVVINGYTYRNVSMLLPRLLIVSLCMKAGNIVLLLLGKAIPSLAKMLPDYLITSSFLYCFVILTFVAGFVTTLLFLLLCLRGRKALTRRDD